MTETADRLLDRFRDALDPPGPWPEVRFPGGGTLPSVFAVSDLAQASVGAAAGALASLTAATGQSPPPRVTVDRDLAAAWFEWSIRPQGWSPPPAWDPVAGDYRTQDGWIRLHTNSPAHRAAALAVLEVPADRGAVSRAVEGWEAEALESAVVDAGGAAAAMRSLAQWQGHPQGMSVGREPLMHIDQTSDGHDRGRGFGRTGRPLEGLRVLDLTRVLAGPVATRLLAGWGAEVLRIDPPGWDEPALVPEMTLGKHCARLDLRTNGGRDRFTGLLRRADVLVHGYRSDALDRLGLGSDVRADIRPGLVDVSLDAYGWTGPWAGRRGFDSLVQMSTGIADAGRSASGSVGPAPLPVQALDHATGYLLAAGAIVGIARRLTDGHGTRWRTSLARMAELLVSCGSDGTNQEGSVRSGFPEPIGPVEHTAWGDALRLPPPVVVEGAPLHWSIPSRPLGTDPARWDTA